jgi:hypothetical protein
MLAGACADVDGWFDAGWLELGWLGSPQAWPIINAAMSSVADRRRLSALADRDRVMCAEA